MRQSLYLVVVFLIVGFSAKSEQLKRSSRARGSYNIGGKVVSDGGAPWQVAIMRNRKLICGGSLLRNNVVLTAAVCIKDVEPADLLIRAGTKVFKTGGQVRKVRETVYYPDFMYDLDAHNIALLHLIRPFNTTVGNIGRIKIAEPNAELPSAISVYGWGMSGSKRNVTMTKNLRFSKAKVYSTKKCAQYLKDESTDFVFCTGDRAKNVDVCTDDLGSPAVAENNVQFGVVSRSGACSQMHTTIFTNLLSYNSWIEQTLQEFKTMQNKDMN